MSISVTFLPAAVRDAEEAIEYYNERSPGLGTRFRVAVESVCAQIAEHPLLWRERRGGYRRVNIPGFPYYIAYIARGDEFVISAIGHASRRPDYWKRRRN